MNPIEKRNDPIKYYLNSRNATAKQSTNEYSTISKCQNRRNKTYKLTTT